MIKKEKASAKLKEWKMTRVCRDLSMELVDNVETESIREENMDILFYMAWKGVMKNELVDILEDNKDMIEFTYELLISCWI